MTDFDEKREAEREYQRAYRQKYRERLNEYMREWYKAHPYGGLSPEERAKRQEAKREYRKKFPERMREQRRRYYEANADKLKAKSRNRSYDEVRRLNLKSKYNLTPEEFESLAQRFDGACWICKRVSKLSVDHVSTSSGTLVRGLLCRSCNLGLGMFLDSKVSLRAALEYLESSEPRD